MKRQKKNQPVMFIEEFEPSADEARPRVAQSMIKQEKSIHSLAAK